MPKVSVIIPVYNTEKYIEKCLESVKDQILKNIEIIVVNDGSTDDSSSIIKKFINNNQLNIKYLEKENGGLSDARNYGIQYATGDYICLLDSDDYLDKNLLKNLEKYIEQKIDVIKYKFIKIDEDGNEIERSTGPVFENVNGQEAFKKLFTRDNYLEVACLYLYKRSFWNSNKFLYPKERKHEDFALTPLILIQANSVVSTAEYGYYYVERKNSITTNRDYENVKSRIDDLIYHYDNMNMTIKNKNIDENTKKIVYAYYTNTILYRLKDIRKEDRNKYINEIKKRKMLNNVIKNDIKSLIKYLILKIDINKYVEIIKKREKANDRIIKEK